MSGNAIHQTQFLLIVLLVFIVGFGILAQRLKIAYPIVFVLGGLVVSFIPGLPAITLNPDFIFCLPFCLRCYLQAPHKHPGPNSNTTLLASALSRSGWWGSRSWVCPSPLTG